MPLAQATPAQELAVLPVGEALSDQDADRIPDRLGELVVLSGVLTTDPYPGVQATESRAYLQDSSGGIRLVAYDLSGLAGLERGDSLSG